MRDELDREVQQWFERSRDETAREPFTLAVLEHVRRRERILRLQRHAALLLACVSFCLLLWELIAPLKALSDDLAALPLAVVTAGGARWPVLVLLVVGLAYALIRQARGAGFLRAR